MGTNLPPEYERYITSDGLIKGLALRHLHEARQRIAELEQERNEARRELRNAWDTARAHHNSFVKQKARADGLQEERDRLRAAYEAAVALIEEPADIIFWENAYRHWRKLDAALSGKEEGGEV